MAFTVRGVTLGAGQPKIIVPVLADTLAGCLAQASALAANPAAELVEFRLDGLRTADPAELADAVKTMRGALGEAKPLLATLRSAGQGGQLAISPARYAAIVTAVSKTGSADLIDLEFDPAHPGTAASLADTAKAAGLRTIFSHHDFAATPPVGEMTNLLVAMGRAGAEIAKLAVMPASPADAALLLQATALARADLDAAGLGGTLLITMSMGATGQITRVCGGAFGSVASFGAAGVSSAPGQPEAGVLARVIGEMGKL